MNAKKTLFILTIMTFLFPLTLSTCPNSPIYIAQEFSTFEYLTWNLFSQHNLNATKFTNSYSSYSIVTPGNSFCLDSEFYLSGFITPNPTDSFWSLWQTYGLLYGYTFHEFVISNLIQNNGGSGSTYEKTMEALELSNEFDPYYYHDSYKPVSSNLEKIYLNSVFDLNYQSNLTKINNEILDSVTPNLNRKIDFLLTTLDPSDLPDYRDLSIDISDLSKLNLDVKVIIFNQSNLDKGSISLATFSNLIYSLEFTPTPRDNKPADYDPILILLCPNNNKNIFSISFLPDSPFLDYDPNFFFDLINIGTNHLKDNKDISFIIKDISLKLKLSKELKVNSEINKGNSFLDKIK
jgi:hypothetical protein